MRRWSGRDEVEEEKAGEEERHHLHQSMEEYGKGKKGDQSLGKN